MVNKNKKLYKNRLSKKGLSILLILLVGSAMLWFFGLDDSASDKITSPKPTNTVKKPSETPKVTKDGGVLDTSGDATNQDSQDGISSASGDITVFQPQANSLIKSGFSVSGKSNENIVSYRLIDDNVGVIASGILNVVSGKFSGKFNFSTQGSRGRFDVFHTLSDGREVDVVEIPIRFK